MKTVLTGFLALLMSLVGLNAMAVLTIEITEGGDSGIPIAVVPFEFEGRQKPEQGLRSVIAADLHRSGRFELLPTGDFLSRPGHPDQVRFKDWRLIKAEALVVGRHFRKSPITMRSRFSCLTLSGNTKGRLPL